MGPMRPPPLRVDDRRMKKLIAVIGLALLATVPAYKSDASAAPSGDVVRAWNDQALNTVRAKSLTDAVAARTYAMVNAAMYDAVNGLSDKKEQRTPAIVAPAAGAKGDPVAAASQAAHDVLVGLNGDRASHYDTQLAADLAAIGESNKTSDGRTWGSEVAAGVLSARANDGTRDNEPQVGDSSIGNFPGTWQGTQFRNMAPFAIADSGVYTGAQPPALESLDYATAFNEVKVVGSAANADPSKDATFNFWKLPSGSGQPAGAWLQVAQAVSASRSLSLHDTARLFALQSVAMADVVAPTVMTKWKYHSWRPVSAINQANSDANPLTTPDANGTWIPRGGNSGNPEYFSGHSSFSSAGAQALAGFFCSDHIPFTLTTDFPGSTRTYSSFSSAAAEAGRSRVLGGLHFEFSNQAAGATGRAVADEVLSRSLLRTTGATHHGDCPL